jgi:hypothetical protein
MPAKFVGIIDNAPDEPTATVRAIAKRERQADGAAAGLRCPQNESASALGTEALVDEAGGWGGELRP